MTKSLLPVTALLLTAGLFIFPKIGIPRTGLFQEGESVTGSTTSILLMGILIVLIIVIPIVLTRRKWMR